MAGEKVPVKLTQSAKVRGPLIVAGDWSGVGSPKVAVEAVTLPMQLEQVPEGGKEVRDPDVPTVAR
ncbi:MAG: hypothetical protein AUI50_08055 [Crenarchaeota archaeon 13_1_40CM_2_52_14]|nr:MAG: hypothetical protein AUI50_08055 [Crenarchaeota archaeon 13_1_40CM_2_52_14]OLE68292.1 MAG: hypothetical protein AUF78_16695 [archaeon 13_1_20CM_2_51_12]